MAGTQNSGYYSVVASNSITGCSVSSGVNISVTPFANVQIVSGGPGCAPHCATFSVQGNGSADWNFGDIAITNTLNTIQHCYSKAGTYTITVKTDNTIGCDGFGVTTLSVFPPPVADFNFAPIDPVAGQYVEFTDASHGGTMTSWNWYFMNTGQYQSNAVNPTFKYEEPGSYAAALVIKNEHGCLDTIVKVVKVEEDFGLYIPNTFTPNSDELNDIFQPKGTGLTKYSMRIYDRWGEMLFETQRFEKGSDGLIKGNYVLQMSTLI
jgi:gliding motility-associated-like protein